MTVRETRDVIPLLPAMYDEPFADSSQIPTHLVSRFAREQVTVALTGDGGDELFAGYNRHFAAPRLWQQLQRVPQPLRASSGSSLGRLPSQFWSGVGGLLPGRRQPHFGGKVQKALRVAASAGNFDEVYCSLPRRMEPRAARRCWAEAGTAWRFDLDIGADAPDAVRMMYCDGVSYLPDDILAKVDRASMAVALETRVPVPRPPRRRARGAHPARHEGARRHGASTSSAELLDGLVPRELVERPKAGFGIPVGQWIKGPLRPWAEDLLDPGAAARRGLVRRRGGLRAAGAIISAARAIRRRPCGPC